MRKSKVMIVASSPFQLALMGDLLEANEITTLRESSVEAAVAALDTVSPVMIVVDLDLAEADCKALDRLKGKAKECAVPLLLVAEKGQRAVAEQVLGDLNAETVEKPIDTSGFPRKVVQEIRRHTTMSRPAEA